MKKNFFMLAATAALFAACAETDLVNDLNIESNGSAIGFETFAQKATRAENSDAAYVENDLSGHHHTFKVWASKKVASSTEWIEVYAASEPGVVSYNGEWTANPLKYWDKAAQRYEFYAAAPSTFEWKYQNATDKDATTGYITLDDFVLRGAKTDNLATGTNTQLHVSWFSAGDDKDLLVADKCPIASTHYYNVAAPQAVNLDFIHILSRLNIAVKKNSTAEIIVKKLEVYGLNNKGSFNENGSKGDELKLGTFKRWESSEDGVYVLTAANEVELQQDVAVYTHEYLVIPQKQTNKAATNNSGVAPQEEAYIYIEYTVNKELYKTYYGLAQVFGVAQGKGLNFNEGWQNTLTITIAPDAIQFTGDVAEWSTKFDAGKNID